MNEQQPVVSEEQALRIDLEMLRLKKSNAYDRMQDAQALRLQIELATQTKETK